MGQICQNSQQLAKYLNYAIESFSRQQRIVRARKFINNAREFSKFKNSEFKNSAMGSDHTSPGIGEPGQGIGGLLGQAYPELSVQS